MAALQIPWPRLVATDLDGTLLRRDGSVSDRTRAVLARVEDAGAHLVLVTGRPPRWMPAVASELGHHGLAICANGGLVYDLRTEQVLASFTFAPDVLADAVARLRAAVPTAAFAVERPTGSGREPSYRSQWPTPPDAVHAPIDELIAGADVVKLLVRSPDLDADSLLAEIRDALGWDDSVSHSNVRDRLVEIAAPGITKATTLARVCEERSVAPTQVVAFGDMPNDVPLLTWAGHAIAVANAHPDVIDVADEVTDSNQEDGVAGALERWFPA